MKVLAAFLVVLAGLVPAARTQAGEHPSLRLGDHGQAVVEVQFVLISHGYVGVAADGIFGARTERAVRHWQHVNRLTVDGVVGAQTWSSLIEAGPATTSVPVAPQTPPVPTFTDDCAEMTFYRQQAGLPDAFDAIGFRESRCHNGVTSRTGCCVGWLQIYLASSMRAAGYRDGVAACGVNSVDDIRGDNDRAKRGQMCVAKVMYDVSGLSPWRL